MTSVAEKENLEVYSDKREKSIGTDSEQRNMQTQEGQAAFKSLEPADKETAKSSVEDTEVERQTDIRPPPWKITESVTQIETEQVHEKKSIHPSDSECTASPKHEKITSSTSSTDKES